MTLFDGVRVLLWLKLDYVSSSDPVVEFRFMCVDDYTTVSDADNKVSCDWNLRPLLMGLKNRAASQKC